MAVEKELEAGSDLLYANAVFDESGNFLVRQCNGRAGKAVRCG